MEVRTWGDRLEERLSENAVVILVFVLGTAVLATMGVVGAYAWYFREIPTTPDPTASWGQLGDYFGGVLNPIFGFLSVFALLVALVIQTRELKLSREALKVSQEELTLTRQEQAKAAEALSLQNQAIQRQSFEQTFFAMLRLLDEVFKACSIETMSRTKRGSTQIFGGPQAVSEYLNFAFFSGIPHRFDPTTFKAKIQEGLQVLGDIDEAGRLTQYARTLLITLEYLAHSEIPADHIYPRTLRSQLPRDGVRLIFFLCLDERWAKLKESVERYRLLANLDPEDTGIPNDFHTLFCRSAFQQ